MELILTCICKNPPLSSDPFPPSLYHPFHPLSLHLPSYSHHHPAVLFLTHFHARLSSSLNHSPQLAHSCPTFIPTKPLLTNYQPSPHYFSSLSLSPLSTLTFSHPLFPQSIIQLPTLFHISHSSYRRLSYHSYIQICLLSHPTL